MSHADPSSTSFHRRSVRRRRAPRPTVVATVWLLLVATLVGISTSVAAADPTADTTAAAAPAPGVTWSLTDHLGRDSLEAAAACPVATGCWALAGGELLQTSDSGVTWADRGDLVPRTVRGLRDISCPTATRCFVTAFTDTAALVLVLDGGAVTPRAIPGASGRLRVDCATATRCLATDGTNVFRTADAGVSWAGSTMPLTVPAPALSCAPGTSTCVVVGTRRQNGPVAAVERSRDGGVTWQALPVPTAYLRPAGLLDVDCVTAATCRIAGYHRTDGLVLTTADAGVGATAATLPGDVSDLTSISCTAVTTCRAVGRGVNSDQRGVRTTDGTHWVSDPVSDDFLIDPIDIACPVGGRCVAVTVGLAHRAAADGHWIDVSLPAALRTVTAASCANDAPCIVVGYDAANRPLALRGAPGAWTETRMPAAVGSPRSVDCATSSVCTVLSQYTVPGRPDVLRGVWRTVDGGATWSAQTVPAPASGTGLAVDCPTVTVCLAVGLTRLYEPDVLRTVDGGGTWTRVAPPDGARDVRDVSCATAASCVLVGRGSFSDPPLTWRTTDVGSTVSPAVPLTTVSNSNFSELACSGAACVAAGYAEDPSFARSADNGRTWTLAPPPVTGVSYLDALACTPSGRCGVVASRYPRSPQPLTSVDGGATWRVDGYPVGVRHADVMACSDSGCFSIGGDRYGRPVVLAEPVA